MSDVHFMARTELKKALSEYFLGFEYEGASDEEVLDQAVEKALKAVDRLLTVQAPSQLDKGVTVMTADASLRNGKDGLQGIRPRNL